jgi:ABC-type Mn2+/Zn2+ transport system ATPase subunit
MPCECSSPGADLAVEALGVQVSIEGRPVLQDVDLQIARGQLVAVIGPNGAGKTTLLRCLLGLQKLSGGAVRLFGQADLRGVLPRVGYVPQRWSLDRSFILSVREFLALRLPETRHWFWRRRRRTDELISAGLPELGVSAWFDQPLARLSGGQLQRVLIAFSLLGKPDLLLLDEPTAGVDMPGEQTFYELIAEVHRQHRMTVVLVSHDLSMVYRQATWVYALNRTICCAGPPEQVMNAESLKTAYGIHVAPYQHHHVR